MGDQAAVPWRFNEKKQGNGNPEENAAFKVVGNMVSPFALPFPHLLPEMDEFFFLCRQGRPFSSFLHVHDSKITCYGRIVGAANAHPLFFIRHSRSRLVLPAPPAFPEMPPYAEQEDSSPEFIQVA